MLFSASLSNPSFLRSAGGVEPRRIRRPPPPPPFSSSSSAAGTPPLLSSREKEEAGEALAAGWGLGRTKPPLAAFGSGEKKKGEILTPLISVCRGESVCCRGQSRRHSALLVCVRTSPQLCAYPTPFILLSLPLSFFSLPFRFRLLAAKDSPHDPKMENIC